jgi:hypothetical protein
MLPDVRRMHRRMHQMHRHRRTCMHRRMHRPTTCIHRRPVRSLHRQCPAYSGAACRAYATRACPTSSGGACPDDADGGSGPPDAWACTSATAACPDGRYRPARSADACTPDGCSGPGFTTACSGAGCSRDRMAGVSDGSASCCRRCINHCYADPAHTLAAGGWRSGGTGCAAERACRRIHGDPQPWASRAWSSQG